jgi:23S rRNA pseudouridine955/2504/2580 synthase
MNALAAKPEAPKESGPVRPSDARLVRIDEAHAGQRLDNYLIGQLKGVPKSHVYRIVRSGEVRVNKGRAGPDQRLDAGDLVRIPPVRMAVRDAPAPVPGHEFPVLFEDDALLAIDKPAGVAVHGGSGVSFGVIEQLRAARPQAPLLELVHRIDRETSGVLLVAKKRSALVGMHAAMRTGVVRKRYRAIVGGHWDGGAQVLRYPLHKFHTPEGERRVVVRDGGQPAGTRVRPLARLVHPRLGPFTLLEAELETGRTHQIRVHLAHVGHPLAGDEKYGDFELNRSLQKAGHKRMFLHAFQIGFRHPTEARAVWLEAPVPAAFDRFVESCPNGARDATV